MNSSDPFIPYGRQFITDDDISSVIEVLRSQFLTQGPCLPAFERAIASKVCASYAIGVNSATSALHVACLALGLGPGDYLWTSPITFVASANCARYCGANVDFVDIDPSTGLMSIDELASKLKIAECNNTLPKIVIPVHLCGTSCDMSSIHSLAEHYGFSIIEDASHAIGGYYNDTPVGSCIYSSITVFSFHPVKIITTGEGGMATTNDPHLAQRMRDLRSHGITKDPDRFVSSVPTPWSYEQQDLGFNYRMTDIQAALGLNQLTRLDSIVRARKRLFDIYLQSLSSLPLQFLNIPSDVISSLHLAVIRLTDCSPSHHASIFSGLRDSQIGVQLHYTPVHLQPYYRNLGFKDGDFPHSEFYAKNAISIPLYPGLTPSEQSKVISVLTSLLS